MSIWFKPPDIAALNALRANTMDECLGITYTEVGDDYLRATLPVDARSVQPYRILHGGASVVLAESLASLAAALCVDLERFKVVGVEISASHLRVVPEGGQVTGTARPIHIGRSSQVWEIDIRDDQNRRTCISRLTARVIEAR